MSSPSAPLYTRDYVLLNAANLIFSLHTTIFLFLPAYLYRLGIREGTIGVLMAVGTPVGVALKPAYGMVVGRGLRGVPDFTTARPRGARRRDAVGILTAKGRRIRRCAKARGR